MSLPNQKACVIFNKLIVNNIENSSGIFIGTNQAIAWSSYSKSNQGFGILNDAVLTNAVNVVYDQDVLDASVEDLKYIHLSKDGQTLQQSTVEFQSVNANTVTTGSAIDLGDNKQLGWRSNQKVNYGTGKSLGSNRLSQIASLVMDNDLIDAPFHIEAITNENPGNAEKNIRIRQKNKEAGEDS